uniref:Uncharacterized protein n=1 Tax=Apteryx owenii TaxID=8824 RepID=A0A8B9PHV7_APTOW
MAAQGASGLSEAPQRLGLPRLRGVRPASLGLSLTCLCPALPAQLQAQKLRLAHSRGPYYSGSLPNVNQIGSGVSEFQVTKPPSPLCSSSPCSSPL